MAFVPDLGKDVLRQFVRTDSGFVECGITTLETPGVAGPYGPRYLQFHDKADLCFVVNELSSTISVFRLDSKRLESIVASEGKEKASVLQFLGSYSTIPEGCSVKNTCGRICVTPDGNHVVVSNRGHDSLTVYKIVDMRGGLEHVQTISSGGRTPRHFKFTPNGRFLMAA